MKKLEVKDYGYVLNGAKLISGGLIAISLILTQVFVASGVFNSANALDIPALICVLAFAFAIPPLVASFVIVFRIEARKYVVKPGKGFWILYIVGVVSVYIGIVAAFWHVIWIAGVIFLVSTFVAVSLGYDYTEKLLRLDDELKAQNIQNLTTMGENKRIVSLHMFVNLKSKFRQSKFFVLLFGEPDKDKDES
jgi:hypothetical protein